MRSLRRGGTLLAVAALVLACGDGGKSTGPSGATEITLALKGVEANLVDPACIVIVRASQPGSLPRMTRADSNGRATLLLARGEWTFTVEITCQKAGGPQTFTSSVNATVGAGPLTLNFPPVAVNSPPSASVNCSPSFVNPGTPSFCTCSARDADPNDVVTTLWGASGGDVSPATGPSTEFSAGSPGTYEVACTARDNRGGVRSATTTVTVGQLFTLTVNLFIFSFSPGGAVTSDPPGISCSGVGGSTSGTVPCSPTPSAQFPQGTMVTLTATPFPSGSLDGWDIGPCSGSAPPPAAPLTVTMNSDVTVCAEFD